MSWPLVTLADVGTFRAGFGFPNKFQGKQSGDYPFAKVGDISVIARAGGKYISKAGNYLDDAELKEVKAKPVPAGAIVFAKIGEAISQNFRAITSVEMLIDNNAMALVPDLDKVDTDYLYHFMCKLDLYPYAGATTVPSLRKSVLEGIQIPLPPLPEQKRIAAILDKADAIRRKRQQAIQLADDFLRAVFLDMFGDPVTNPKGWDVKPLSAGIRSISSGWSASGENRPCSDGEKGVLKISAVTSGVFKPEENKTVPLDQIPEGKKLLFPKRGDLLFSRANTRELVAASCIVMTDVEDVFLPDKLWLVETDQKKLLPEFLNYLLWQPRFKERLTSQATGTSGSMLNISKSKFEETDAFFPNMELQEKFKRIYWALQETLDASASSREAGDSLFESLSQKAFSGQL
ncbi:restriction endonuclease subunit S [Pseudomonas aeruginosa]|uniref:restriction endonuclease subunit S n=1 Tax=Pseudomonas aeruginosa TaxID=287 RepID=UPI00106B1C10|nr:restriction endonuclease subunit S [Pseudomonas aeruginosa]MDX3923279.1 restriction endonuclease subunit S [Pseudomonas aeruginosa]